MGCFICITALRLRDQPWCIKTEVSVVGANTYSALGTTGQQVTSPTPATEPNALLNGRNGIQIDSFGHHSCAVNDEASHLLGLEGYQIRQLIQQEFRILVKTNLVLANEVKFGFDQTQCVVDRMCLGFVDVF